MSDPNSAADEPGRLEAVLAGYIREVEAGRQPDLDPILARHPDLADDLRAFIGHYDAMRALAPSLREGARPASSTADYPLSGLATTRSFPSAAPPAGSLLGRVIPSVAGEKDDQFELLEVIASGGMGVVYRARQLRLDRLVAVKLILVDPAIDQDRAHLLGRLFEHEVTACGRLDHPNILPIYGCGTDQGFYYIAMKLVEAGNLARHLERFAGDQATVARLIRQVATAVDHAHSKGILHRDLKPANILVDGPHDVPLVIDFGLALRMDRDGGPSPLQAGAVVGTRRYMAPEQVTRPAEVDRRADVFSLGVILYELLTMRLPVPEGQPPEEFREDYVRRGPGRPRAIDRRLKRDLEAICLKCLRADPADRYRTAIELADDLERFLRGMPTAARPLHPWVRAARWARRRPIATAAMAGLAMMLVYNFFAVRSERQQARRYFGHALQATREMLTQVGRDDLRNLPQVARVRRALLEKAVAFYTRLAEEQPNDPGLRFAIGQSWIVVGDLYRRLGELDRSEDALRQAAAILERLATSHPEEPNYRAEVAAARQTLALSEQMHARPKLAEDDYVRALGLLRELVQAHPDRPLYLDYLVHTQANLAAFHQATGDGAKAIELTREVVAALDQPRLSGPSHRFKLAKALDNLGGLYIQALKPDEAEAALGRALSIRRELTRSDEANPAYRHDLATSLHNMGFFLVNFRRTAEGLQSAERSLAEAIRINDELVEKDREFPEHRLALVGDHQDLGDLHAIRGELDASEAEYRRAVAVAEGLARDFPETPGYRELFLQEVRALVDWSRRQDRLASTSRFLVPILEGWRGPDAGRPGRPSMEADLAAIREQLRD